MDSATATPHAQLQPSRRARSTQPAQWAARHHTPRSASQPPRPQRWAGGCARIGRKATRRPL